MKTLLHTLLFVLATALCSLAMADPPGRVGRISYLEGEVLFGDGSSNEMIPAALNWPLTSQNVLSTGRGSRAELRVGGAAVRIGPDSELEITQLDDNSFKLYLAWGSANVRVRSRDLAQDFELYTPQGRILLPEPSRIRVDVDDESRTGLSVYAGAARFEGGQANLPVRTGKHVEFVNGDIRISDLGRNYALDDLDGWSLARDQRDDQSVTVRYLSEDVTGYEELDANGIWQETTAYGPVWFPRSVPSGWAPYRSGRWSWIEPWGWTWIDNASWGYAPSHYGRWVVHQNRWCWVPGGVRQRQVWAPALVGWVGGHNWNVAFSSGTAPAIGWFPLGPREVYVPTYRVSPTYVRRVNVPHVANVNVSSVNGVISVPPPNKYRNRTERNALTVVPQERFVSGKGVPVAGIAPPEHLPRQLPSAPVSAVAPTEIARRHQPVEPAPAGARVERNRRPVPGQPLAPQGHSNPQPAAQLLPPATGLGRPQKPEPQSPAVIQAPRPEERQGNRGERIERIERVERNPNPAPVVTPQPAPNPPPARSRIITESPRPASRPEEHRAAPVERVERGARPENTPPARVQPNPEPPRPVIQAPRPEARPVQRPERNESAAPGPRNEAPSRGKPAPQERAGENPSQPAAPEVQERQGLGREPRGARIER